MVPYAFSTMVDVGERSRPYLRNKLCAPCGANRVFARSGPPDSMIIWPCPPPPPPPPQETHEAAGQRDGIRKTAAMKNLVFWDGESARAPAVCAAAEWAYSAPRGAL